MTDEITEIMKLFNITEEQAVLMIEKGFKLNNLQSSVETYVNTQIEAFTETYKTKLRDIVTKELNQD